MAPLTKIAALISGATPDPVIVLDEAIVRKILQQFREKWIVELQDAVDILKSNGIRVEDPKRGPKGKLWDLFDMNSGKRIINKVLKRGDSTKVFLSDVDYRLEPTLEHNPSKETSSTKSKKTPVDPPQLDLFPRVK